MIDLLLARIYQRGEADGYLAQRKVGHVPHHVMGLALCSNKWLGLLRPRQPYLHSHSLALLIHRLGCSHVCSGLKVEMGVWRGQDSGCEDSGICASSTSSSSSSSSSPSHIICTWRLTLIGRNGCMDGPAMQMECNRIALLWPWFACLDV